MGRDLGQQKVYALHSYARKRCLLLLYVAAPELGAGDAGLHHTQPLDSQLVYSSREDGWENVIGNWECNLMLLVEKAETSNSVWHDLGLQLRKEFQDRA